MSKFTAVVAALLSTLSMSGMAQASNYLDDIARLDAQIAIQRKQIEARDLAIQAAGRINLPTIRSVSGFDEDLTAVVTYGNGRKLIVKRGDQLPGGVEVKGVRQNGVLVAVGKQVALLEFSVADEGGVPPRDQPTGLMPPLPQVNVPLPGSIGQQVQPLQVPLKQQPSDAGRKQVATGPASEPVAGPQPTKTAEEGVGQGTRASQAQPGTLTKAPAASTAKVLTLASQPRTPAAVATTPAAASAAAPSAQTALAIGRSSGKSD